LTYDERDRAGEIRGRTDTYRFPCNSGAPTVISRTPGALALWFTQASVAEFRRQTLDPDAISSADPRRSDL